MNTSQYEPNVVIYERLGFKVRRFAEIKSNDDSIEVLSNETLLTAGIWNGSKATAPKMIAMGRCEVQS